jgi:type II secretory ATPase GspE/PulE/Tfp pilus assembly ATPase PilB-like protein
MGVPPFLISAVLNTVVAQRLVRKIHLNCVESYEPDATILSAIHRELLLSGVDPKSIKLPKTFYRGKGCSGCNFLGFVGRIGIYEVLNITEAVRKLIMDGSFSMDMLRAQAQKEGMVMMFEDGLRKVERGTTTIEEVMRVIRE